MMHYFINPRGNLQNQSQPLLFWESPRARTTIQITTCTDAPFANITLHTERLPVVRLVAATPFKWDFMIGLKAANTRRGNCSTDRTSIFMVFKQCALLWLGQICPGIRNSHVGGKQPICMLTTFNTGFNITAQFISQFTNSPIKVLLLGQCQQLRTANPPARKVFPACLKPSQNLMLNRAGSFRQNRDVFFEGHTLDLCVYGETAGNIS